MSVFQSLSRLRGWKAFQSCFSYTYYLRIHCVFFNISFLDLKHSIHFSLDFQMIFYIHFWKMSYCQNDDSASCFILEFLNHPLKNSIFIIDSSLSLNGLIIPRAQCALCSAIIARMFKVVLKRKEITGCWYLLYQFCFQYPHTNYQNIFCVAKNNFIYLWNKTKNFIQPQDDK